MPTRTYMQVDDRRDHSFRVPRPDLSTERFEAHPPDVGSVEFHDSLIGIEEPGKQ